jgi:DNA-directed RNA polymerase subunit RPC12/RpoP
VQERSKLVINDCPECGHPWSSVCPLCGRPLEAIRRGHLSRCLRCNSELRPAANVHPTVRLQSTAARKERNE